MTETSHWFTVYAALIEDDDEVRIVIDWADTYQGSQHDDGVMLTEFHDDEGGPEQMDRLLMAGAVGEWQTGGTTVPYRRRKE